MQRNYHFSESNSINKTIEKLQKLNFKKIILALLFLTISNSSYSQLAIEYFETGIPSSWAITSNLTVTNNWSATATGGYLASGGAFVNPALNNTIGTTAEYFMVTPQFLTPTNGEIRFFTKQGSFTNRGTIYQVRISTASQPDVSSFNVVLASWNETQLNVSATTYEEKIVPIPSIPAGIPVYVAFVAITNQTGATNTIGDTWYVDNARVISACPPVSGITTTMGPDSAIINWTHPTATQFGIEVVPQGAGHGATGTPVSGFTYTANGLSNNTNYDVYIITNCDSTTNSSWAGPFPITTTALGFACGTPLIIPPNLDATPYVLSTNLNTFNDPVNYVAYNSQGLSCQPINTPSTWNWFSGDHAFLSYTPASTGLVNISQVVSTTSGGGCFGNASSSVFIFDSCAGVGTNASCLGSLVTGSAPFSTSASLENFYVEAGHTYIFLISSPYQATNGGASICFTFTISAPTCPIPSGIVYNNLTQNSIDFSWDNPQNFASNWEYVAIPANLGAPNGTETVTSTSTNINNPITGLISGTAYNFYVRSVCSGTPGPWSVAIPFTTLCPVLSLPYYTGFTNATEIDCWSQLNLNNDAYFFNFGNSANSEPVAKIRPANSNDMLISPQFHFDGVTQKRLRFKYNIYGNWGSSANPTPGPGSFEIRLSSTGVGPNNFTTVLVPLAQYTTAYDFIEMIVPLPANLAGDINIAWVLPDGATQTGVQTYFDDVYIENMPACSEPSYPTVTAGSITTTSAEISWTNGYNNTQWELVAQPLGTGTPTSPGIIVNTNPYTLTNLIPSTQYEFYMRAYCSSTEQSIWVGPINFNTLCVGQFDPYYESFNDDDVNTKKFCWSVNNPDGDITMWRIEATEASIRAISTFSVPFVSFDDWLISVPITSTGQKRLRFDYRAATQFNYPTARGNFEVLMSPTSDFSTYTTLIPSHDFLNSNYLEDSVIFNASGTFYIAFRVPPTMIDPSNSGIIMLDNVRIEDVPLCPIPTDLTASAITTSSATLSWLPGNTETQWEIVVQSPLSGIPSGSGITVNGTPSYNATGLSTDTAYEYYVRAICQSPDISSWVGPFSFRTICDVLPTPFIETFDSNSPTKTCWNIVNGNGDGSEWNLYNTVNPMFGDQMAAFFTGSNGNNDDWLISPTLTANANQRLRFYFKVYDNNFKEDLKVKLSTNGIDTNQFSTILYENNFSTNTDTNGTVIGSNTITVTDPQGVRVGDTFYIPGFPIPFGSTVTAINGSVISVSDAATIALAGPLPVVFTHETLNNTTIREFVINLTDITSPTNINIGFYTPFFPPNPWAYRGQYSFIDNVIVEDIPVCPSVINVTTSNIIDTAADVNWQEVGSATSWEISVQPFGTPAPIGNTLPAYLVTTTTHPKTITGLTPATKYQYYVRAVCSTSDQSEWIGPFEFTTHCDFANVCQYTISTISGSTGQVTESVNVMQNGSIVQALEFPGFGQTQIDYTVFMCTGVAFDLYWDGLGSGVQYSQAQIIIRDESNNIIWTSPLGLGTVNTNIYSGFATCGTTTCSNPTNLTLNNQGVLSWTPGGSETQWEVFIQPLGNGTLPQSGTIVNSPFYTPVASDFTDPTASTYEYFVRAICGASNESYWSGPKAFIRNDEPATAVHLQVNSGETCEVSGIDASFIGATASTTPTSCSGVNGGDIWFDFVATSKVHIIELSDFTPGNYYTSSYEGPWPKIIMSLYEVQSDGSLIEKGCSEDNSMVTSYTKELIVGNTYKIRLKLDGAISNDKKFHICITTPSDVCNLDAFNYDFEKLQMQYVTGIYTIINSILTPGWRTNTTAGQMYFNEATNSANVTPYSGGQSVQLIQDSSSTWNASDPNIKGLYRDFDTSEITQMDYSFASASRTNGTTVQLYAGPPSGPFTLVTEHTANSLIWQIVQGNYMVPNGQATTRFIFRVKNYAIGHLLDAANFKPNTDIVTSDATITCSNTASILLEAHGVGQWVADTNNPATTNIETPNANSTNVSGFTAPGNYVYHWITRYCDKTVTINYLGINEIPVVTSPVIYCMNATTVPLTATVSSGYSLVWYTVPVGGTGSSTAPTPSSSVVGSSQVYYVSALDGSGCEGTRAEIVVQINDVPTATISGTTTICSGTTTDITFNGTPNAIVTYNVNSGTDLTITLDGSGGATITTPTLTASSTYNLVSVATSGTPSCSQALTESAIVTVTPLPTATISGTTTICSGNTATITFNGTPDAIVTYNVNSGTDLTITLDASGSASITTPTLTANSTYNLVSVATSGTPQCTQTLTGSAIITINEIPTATISGTTTICSGNTTAITFNGTPNAIVTYTVDGGSNQTITLDASGNTSLTTPTLTTNSTYTLVNVSLSGSPDCTQTLSGQAIVTVISLPVAAISGSTTICAGNTTDITFNGTPNAIVTYTINGGSNQTITLDASGNASLTTPVLSANSTYDLVSVSLNGATSCSQLQTGSVTISVNALPTASISGSTSICSGNTATISFNGTPNAVLTYIIDGGSNETITLDASGNASLTTPILTTNSTYTLVSVTSDATPQCTQTLTGTATITVNEIPTATITGNTTICSGNTATITFNGTPNAIVTYTINGGSNQTIVLDATGNASLTTPILSANSTYDLVSVSLNTSSTCSQTLTGSVTITVNALPTASISGTTTICSGNTTVITFNGTPNAVITYTINGGSNQTITLDASGNASITTPTLTANSTYALVSVTSNGTPQCVQSLTGNAVISINTPNTQNLVFSYTTTCINASTNPLPILTTNFTTGGTFSSSTVTVNASTGAITLSSASEGTHQVTYTINPDATNCILGGSYTTSITFTNGITPTTSFDYDALYCSNSGNVLPTTASGFTSGGVFSSTTGLVINSATGEINVSQSNSGTYTITYHVNADVSNCITESSSTDTITISSSLDTAIEDVCQNGLLVLQSIPLNNSYDPNNVNYTWFDADNNSVGTEMLFNVDQYLADHSTAALPLTFNVNVDSDGCTGNATFIVTDNPCKLIPRGISPNNDGDNDTFDLSGLDVKELIIFNRYGSKVYSFNGNYTNQWNGLTDKGNELPDGTYFYNIVKGNGVTVTGWVYINRQY